MGILEDDTRSSLIGTLLDSWLSHCASVVERHGGSIETEARTALETFLSHDIFAEKNLTTLVRNRNEKWREDVPKLFFKRLGTLLSNQPVVKVAADKATALPSSLGFIDRARAKFFPMFADRAGELLDDATGQTLVELKSSKFFVGPHTAVTKVEFEGKPWGAVEILTAQDNKWNAVWTLINDTMWGKTSITVFYAVKEFEDRPGWGRFVRVALVAPGDVLNLEYKTNNEKQTVRMLEVGDDFQLHSIPGARYVGIVETKCGKRLPDSIRDALVKLPAL